MLRTIIISPVGLLLINAALANAPSVNFGSPVGFVPNQGQFMDEHGRLNTAVHYLFRGPGLNVQLRANGFAYEAWLEEGTNGTDQTASHRSHRIDVLLEGCNTGAAWGPVGASTDVLNYYSEITGEDGVTGVHHYREVVRRNIYPFIDLVFRLENESVKYEFIVHPGGDINAIRMHYQGAQAMLAQDGKAIALRWNDGGLDDRVPLSYWRNEHAMERAEVIPVELDANVYGYRLLDEPMQRTLVIDPVPDLQWSTYYGSANASIAFRSVTIDVTGNVIVAGGANVTGLATWGAHDQVYSGDGDALLVKFSATGQRLWATYYGGSDDDIGVGVGHDASGNIYLAGNTRSTTSIATPFTHQPAYNSTDNAMHAFIAKFTPTGTRTWGTYFGPTVHQELRALTVDGAGCPVIGGITYGTGLATPGAADGMHSGTGDGFVAKFSTNGLLSWATYIGGDYPDQVNGLTCDGTFIFAAGETSSSSEVATPGAHDTSIGSQPGGFCDAFLVKYSGLGQKLWGTYYGGAQEERGWSCAAEQGTGIVYLAGQTSSTGSIATLLPHQAGLSGSEDGFLVKFNSNGVRQWGTYYGGTGADRITSIGIGDLGRVFVGGVTASTNGIATSGAEFPSAAGGDDGFAACFNPSGTRLLGTFFGGAGDESLRSIAVRELDFALAGGTNSTSGIATSGAHQTSPGSMFVARFSTQLLFAKSLVQVEDPSGQPRISGAGSLINIMLPEQMVEMTAAFTVRITDLQGRLVLEQGLPPTGTTLSMDVGGVSQGAYVVSLAWHDQMWSQRVWLAGR